MTNRYILQPKNAGDLELSTEIMAHTEVEALEKGREWFWNNHHIHTAVEIIDVERSHDGQHDIHLIDSGDYWQELWINDEMVTAEHSISLSSFMEYLMEASPGQFTFVEEEFPDEEDEESDE